MAAYFMDSSALAKRYVAETGSVWVNGLVRPADGHRIHVSRITGAEVMAALARRRRGGSLGQSEADAAARQLRADFLTVLRISEVSAEVVADAMDLAWRYGLRGYDAVQLSAAVELNRGYRDAGVAMTVVCSDAEFNKAATAEGLAVDDPNRHP